MKVKVINSLFVDWEHIKFPTFKKGTSVSLEQEEDTDFLGWYGCEIQGHKAYIPKHYVCNGRLNRDYNPTELVQKIGDIIEVKEIAYEWLFAVNDKGITGWIPAGAVVSISE